MVTIRRIALIALICMAASAYAVENQVSETVLPNGLKVLIKEVHTAPVFTSQVWYNVGSRNEHNGITGLSHLVEHMMFKGTKKVGKGEFARIIKSKGGMENGGTWCDWTYYYELLSKDHLELALKLEADRMQNALFDPSEFVSERIVVRSELEGYENDPDSLLYQGVIGVAFQAQSYRWPIIGYISDVENVSRDTAYNYYKTYYVPNNATLVIVGDVDTDKTLDLARKYFGSIPKGPEPPKVYTKEPPQYGERRITIRREGNAERVIMAYHIPDMTNPDAYPLMLLDQILAGGKSARLYQAMVEGQIATSAWSSSGTRRDPGLFMFGATGREGIIAAQLEQALLEQVEKAKAAPPTEEEVTRAKNQLETYLVFQNDSVSDQGQQLGFFEAEGSWRYLEMLLPKIKAVTAEDIQRVAQQYLTEDQRTVGCFIPTGQPTGSVGAEGAPGPLNLKTKIMPPLPKPVETKIEKAVEPKRIVLPNGMVVIVQENPSNATVAVRGSLNAGGVFDPSDKKGLASFTAGMLSRGTEKRTALQIASETDFVGADVGVGSDEEAVSFSCKGLSRDFNLLLDVLSDELRNPSFPEDQINLLKGQLLSGLEMEKEDPQSCAVREFKRAIFAEGHPKRPQTIDEDAASIKSISRDDLAAFHKKFYGPETAVIVIVGDVKADEAIAAIEKYFSDWTPTGLHRKIKMPSTTLTSAPSKKVIEMPGKSQEDVIFGHAGLLKRSDPDFYATVVMNQILGGGGGLSSKLGDRIRNEMGLVYSVWSAFDAGLVDGPWIGGFGSNPANVDKAIDAILDVIKGYIKDGPTKEEFNDAVDYITGVFPIRLETNDGVAGILSSAEFYGLGMDYIQKYTSNYKAVTIDQVKEAARKHLHPDLLTIVTAGPNKK